MLVERYLVGVCLASGDILSGDPPFEFPPPDLCTDDLDINLLWVI